MRRLLAIFILVSIFACRSHFVSVRSEPDFKASDYSGFIVKCADNLTVYGVDSEITEIISSANFKQVGKKAAEAMTDKERGRLVEVMIMAPVTLATTGFANGFGGGFGAGGAFGGMYSAEEKPKMSQFTFIIKDYISEKSIVTISTGAKGYLNNEKHRRNALVLFKATIKDFFSRGPEKEISNQDVTQP